MSPWDKILELPHPRGHYVQLYGAGDLGLCKNVGHYLLEGLKRGDGVLMITTPEHRDLFRDYLRQQGADVDALAGARQLGFHDAQQTLSEFMISGRPDWQRFEKVIRAAMRQIEPAKHRRDLRAYGEMVEVLWKARQFRAAIRLEQFWNKLLEQLSFSLYCAYSIDIFGKSFDVANLESVLCTHTHLVPSQTDRILETALNRALEEVLGPEAASLQMLVKGHQRPSWAVMPTVESMVLWLRKNRAEQADQIVSRAGYHYDLMLQTADASA